MIKNIIFDVGNVLVAFCWEKAMMQLGFYDETFEALADATVRSPLWREYDKGKMSDEEILNGFIANDPSQEANIRLFWENVGDVISCYDYSIEWIKELKKKGYRCFILSNYAKRTYEKTREELAFEQLMDGAVFSFQVQQVKPDLCIYRTLTDRYGLLPEECVFLDDTLKNVEAAREFGMKGIHFSTKESAEQELRNMGVDI